MKGQVSVAQSKGFRLFLVYLTAAGYLTTETFFFFLKFHLSFKSL